MDIKPIAFDSMGARGMSCVVRTEKMSFLIDPGVNLAPRRHKLPPHPLEEEKKRSLWKSIEREAGRVDNVILTHYHYDHLNPEGYHVFFEKTVFLKDPSKDINYNQSRRAHLLLEEIESKSREVHYVDGNQYSFENLKIAFSKAVAHGVDRRRGCVVQIAFHEGDFCFLFSSDIEGANLDEQVDFIVEHNPDILLLDGPAVTFPKCRSHRIGEIILRTDLKTLLIDHHLMRESNWKDYVKDVFDISKEKGVIVVSAAGFRGEEENLLEAKREELYRELPSG